MLKISSVSMNGTSSIDGKDVVYFSASFSGTRGDFSSTKNITDMKMYQENQAQCDADFDDFDRTAMDIMSQTSEA